jgi:alkanesulfonate monooxygenase SsuD/methylene tetrahydromethanopterin reductase-like flavin-dependent oxidoreductase (luciferase family)
MTAPKSAVWVPLFGPLAEPAVVVALAVRAEEAGWDGFFVWDHVNWHPAAGPAASATPLADPWITLAAIAAATRALTIGPMVTPLARRRPVKLARETATLDRLSAGRLVLGAGLGSDRFGAEISKTGDELDDRRRAAMLDEGLDILTAAWSGRPVIHRGEHYTVDDVTFEPRPVQATIPIWVAGFPSHRKPLQRAARHQGYFPVNLESADQLSEAVHELAEARDERPDPFDVVVPRPPGTDFGPYADAGATWWATDFDPQHLSVDEIRTVIDAGPLR